MAFGLRAKLGLLGALPAIAAIGSFCAFAELDRSTVELLPTMNVAGRQRMLAAELQSWSSMVAAGQASDRDGLVERIARFDEALVAMRAGGVVQGNVVARAPVELAPVLSGLEAAWRAERVVLGRLLEEGSGAAPLDARLRSGRALQDAAEAYVAALQRHQLEQLAWSRLLFGAVTALDLALLIAGLWLVHRRVLRPLRELAEAARHARSGDFSRRVSEPAEDELGAVAAAFNQAAEELGRRLAAEARFHDVLDHLGDAVVMAAHDGRISYANPAAERLTGRTRAELLGLAVAELMPARYREHHVRAFERREPTPGRTMQAEVLRIDGSVVPIDVAVSSHRVGEELLYTGIMRDVSERVQLTSRMMQMDRMIAAGTLAAGVAHELNNPLAYVVANLSFVADEIGRRKVRCGGCRDAGDIAGLDSLGELAEVVQEARAGTERMRAIVRDLKSFSRSSDDARTRVRLQRTVESSINIAWNEIRHRARLTKDYGDVPEVEANEARLGQVCLNLLVNAAQAIPEGAAAEHEIHVRTRVEGRHVVLTIRDTGAGIAPEHLGRIFDPFFTTKPVGQGTGLGLSICQGILHSMGGAIAVESALGVGTTMRVTLPIANGASAEPSAIAPPLERQQARRRGRVLVVDDEPAIGRAIERTLRAEHEVVRTESGRGALALLAGGAPFDLILSDLMMPELDGTELWSEIARLHPGLEQRIVFLTGGAFTPHARDFLARVPNLRVEKPFVPAELRALVATRVAESTSAEGVASAPRGSPQAAAGERRASADD